MPPIAESQLNTHSAASEDVFGNDMEAVNVWGGEEPEQCVQDRSKPTHSDRIRRVVKDAIKIVEQLPAGSHSIHKPPTTPRSTRRRTMHLELLQRQSQSQKTIPTNIKQSTGDRQYRRSIGSESDLLQNGGQDLKALPRMTPRTRRRKLGLPLAPTMPALGDESPPKPRPLSVAEKRRQRSENLVAAFNSSINELGFNEDNNDDNALPTNSKRNASDLFDGFIESRNAAMQPANANEAEIESFGVSVFNPHKRVLAHNNSSDSNEILFVPNSSDSNEILFVPPGSEKVAKMVDLFDSNEIEFSPAGNEKVLPKLEQQISFEPFGKSDEVGEAKHRRHHHRDARTLEASSSDSHRSSSKNSKNHRRRPSGNAGGLCPMPPVDSTSPPRGYDEDKDGMEGPQDNLNTVLAAEQEENAPPRNHSRQSRRSSSKTRRNGHDSSTPNDNSTEIESRKRSSSSKRREPRRPSLSEKETHNLRSSSVPRADGKIKFIKENTKEDESDDRSKASSCDNKSTRSGKSNGDNRSTISGKSSTSTGRKSNRRPSSSGSGCPPSPRAVQSTPGSKPTRSRSDCRPRNPVGVKPTPTRCRSDAHHPPPRKTEKRFTHLDCLATIESPGKTTPRRKIKYIKKDKGESDTDRVSHPPIPTLG